MSTLTHDGTGNTIIQSIAEPRQPIKMRPPPAPVFIYWISKGAMTFGATGVVFCEGLWSGWGDCMNNPAKTHIRRQGPLPVGLYEYGFARDGGKLGPLVLPLHQVSGETYGRSAFYIHGSSRLDPELSSKGCIIMGRWYRDKMDRFACKIRLLEVRT